eukprot:TRINITY_DN3138_c2_g5_i1.p1 TRINITY_DN3138_c2_g5~~TRINITY_DN3138_c2_g5_i1.p1  ORF type:complete len:174 (+),score=22.12 TRINITY_DN3138_c2_g5_i1:562-1083(+)
MGNAKSIPAASIGEVKARCLLDDKEVQRLRRRFQRLVGDNNDSCSLQQFRAMPEVAGNPYAQRLFTLMDSDGSGSLTFIEFCVGISLYRTWRKSPDGKFRLLLLLHDVDGDGKLSKCELADLMRMSAATSFTDQQLQEAVDLMMAAYDRDGDGALNGAEFGSLAADCGEQLRL